MKRILILISVLLTMVAGAMAEPTVIKEIDITCSDYQQVAVVGSPIKKPTIQITGGDPYDQVIFLDVSEGSWYKKTDSNSSEQVNSGVFTEGTWYYNLKVRCNTSSQNRVLSENTVVKVNGVVCRVHGLYVGNLSWFYVAFPELTITGNIDDGRTEIDFIEAVTTDYAQVAVIGGSVTNKPSASVLGEVQAQFKTSEGRWLETYDWIEEMQSYRYREQTSGTFESGNVLGEHAYFTIHYAFYCPLRVDGNWGKTHRLTENTVVKINGYECHVDGLVIGTDYSYCWVRWPDIMPQKPIAEGCSVIKEVDLKTSDYEQIPVLGGTIKKPSIQITGGDPYDQVIFLDVSEGSWYKKTDSNSSEQVNSGVFTEGTWYYNLKVRCNTSSQYRVLSASTLVKVNGVVCRVSGLVVNSGFSYFYVRFPEITIEDIVLPTSISLNLTSLNLNSGQTNQLKATVLPENATDKTVTWTSSDTNVATVSTDGLVTAVNGGTATITATTSNGKTATCTVKVVIPPTGITLDKQELAFDDVGLTYQLTATVLPENATNKTVTWTSSHPDVATVDDNGLVTAKGEGITFIYAYTSNSKMAYCKVTVGLVKEGTLGTQGFWSYANGVLTVDYIGQMPWDCTRQTTDPEVAYRLKWIDFLSSIDEVVITGKDVEIQPYFLYYEGDGPGGSHPDDHIKKLTLGSGVKKIGRGALALYDLKDVYCYGIEAPELSSDTGGGNCFWKSRVQANAAFLHLVPGASTDYARTDREWTIFNRSTNYLDPADDPVGVKSLTPDPSPVGEGSIYDLSGRKVSKPQKGFNIIRYSDGTTKKVLIK